MGLMDRIKSMFGGSSVEAEPVSEEEAARIREEEEISGVWTDIEGEQAKARDRLQQTMTPNDPDAYRR